MDIDLLSKMVAELILDNDEVALPGVGTFVAEIVPSTFSDKGYTINPPYRRLSFRQKESSDDRLVEFYARNNQLDITTAGSILKEFLSEMKSILMTKKVIVFPGLGRLRATRENNFFFIPDEDLNIYPDGYGLEPVSLKTHEETEDEVKSVVDGLQSLIGSVPSESEAAGEPTENEPAGNSEVQEISGALSEPEDPEVIAVPEPLPEPAAEYHEHHEHHDHHEHHEHGSAHTHTHHYHYHHSHGYDEPAPKHTVWKISLAFVIVAALLLVLFVILSKVAPDFIDSILYSKEELQIIRAFEK